MSKPWTETRSPIAASEADIRKADAIRALLVRPIGILPQAPGDPIRPFAVKLFEEIRQLLKPEVPITSLRRAVGAFVHTKRYYFASAQPDSVRHDIEGEPLEPLSDEDRLLAQQRFGHLLNLKRAEAAAPAEPAEPPPRPPPPEPAVATPSKADLIRSSLLGTRRPRQQPVD